MNSSAPQNAEPRPETLVLAWWRRLQDPAQRGPRAELRRANDLNEVALTPAYHQLLAALRDSRWQPKDEEWERLALIAATLSRIEQDAPEHAPAEQFAAPRKSGQGPRLSGLRFRRLIQEPDHAALFTPMQRVVRQLDKRANVAALARDLYWWNDDVRRRWATDYYTTAPTAQ